MIIKARLIIIKVTGLFKKSRALFKFVGFLLQIFPLICKFIGSQLFHQNYSYIFEIFSLLFHHAVNKVLLNFREQLGNVGNL